MASIDISKLVQESIANIGGTPSVPVNDIDTDLINAKMVDRLEESPDFKNYFKSSAGAKLAGADSVKSAKSSAGTKLAGADSVKSAKSSAGTKLAGADSVKSAKSSAGTKLAGADSVKSAKSSAGTKLAGADSVKSAKSSAGTKLAGADSANKPSSSTTMDKLRSFGSHAKDTAKEAYSQFSHSPKAQMIAGGTAAALGAGLAAKRYMQRKKKK